MSTDINRLVKDAVNLILEEDSVTNKTILEIKQELIKLANKHVEEGIDPTSESLAYTWLDEERKIGLSKEEVELIEQEQSLAILAFDRFLQEANRSGMSIHGGILKSSRYVTGLLGDYIRPNIINNRLINTTEVAKNLLLILRARPFLSEDVFNLTLEVWRKGNDSYSPEFTPVDLVELMSVTYNILSISNNEQLDTYIINKRLDRDAKRIIRDDRRLSLTFYFDNLFKASKKGQRVGDSMNEDIKLVFKEQLCNLRTIANSTKDLTEEEFDEAVNEAVAKIHN